MIKYLIKIDRLSAWGLLLTMLAYFVSGYGMSKGLIPIEPAIKLHNDVLPLLAMIFFTIHTSYALHLALKRWKVWNLATKIILFVVYLSFVASFIYVDQFYDTKVNINQSGTTQATTVDNEDEEDDDDEKNIINRNVSNGTNNTANTNTKVFTLAELARYDGLNGNPPYVAVDGVVYDMTGVFNGGVHFGHKAGTELSDAFYLKHVKSQITKYPVVGTLN